MICFNCDNPTTTVGNSRTHKKTPQVWRRRNCVQCGATFTTYERVSLPDELSVITQTGIATPFSPGLLIIDIASVLQGPKATTAEAAYWLARSIEDNLIALEDKAITTAELKNRVHEALARFQPLAGIQYAATHQLLDKIKRPRKRR